MQFADKCIIHLIQKKYNILLWYYQFIFGTNWYWVNKISGVKYIIQKYKIIKNLFWCIIIIYQNILLIFYAS